MCVHRSGVFLSQQLLLGLLLQQTSLLLHQDAGEAQKGEGQHEQQQAADDEAAPPGSNPLGVSCTDGDCMAEAVHIVLQQEGTQGITQHRPKGTWCMDERCGKKKKENGYFNTLMFFPLAKKREGGRERERDRER